MRAAERWTGPLLAVVALALLALWMRAATHPFPEAAPVEAVSAGVTLAGVPLAFVLFGLVLLGVATIERAPMAVALTGLAAILGYTLLAVPGFDLAAKAAAEGTGLLNLFLLLLGFAVLARHVELSRLPDLLPAVLPDGWTGGVVLLAIVMVLSSVLDNIAAALIGGTIAGVVYKRRVHVGFLAAIVAAANAGGAGSVVGDTTTTMMWLAGVPPGAVVHAFVASLAAFAVFGVIAARQQHALQPIQADPSPGVRLDAPRLAIAVAILLAAVAANVVVNIRYPEASTSFPFIGVGVWIAILAASPWRLPDLGTLRSALRSAVFLLALVSCAALMPVRELPAASPKTALSLGFLSAVFDNIPLTALCLKQGGYDWGMLAYTVGFGGSMIWFGSSAGVALTSSYPESRSARRWVRAGWHVALAYVVGFTVMMLWPGWEPRPMRHHRAQPAFAISLQGDSR